MSTEFADILRLPVAERIQLAEDIWDTVMLEDPELPLSGAQMEELDRRRAELLADSSAGVPWAEARAHLMAQGS